MVLETLPERMPWLPMEDWCRWRMAAAAAPPVRIWDEANFMPNGVQMSNELMTGYFVPGEQTYLSDTTVGTLADLGYTIEDPSVGTSYLVVDSHLLLV